MQILPVKKEKNKRWMKVPIHSISLRQIEFVLKYLGYGDWSGVEIIKDNIKYDDLDELQRHYPVKVKSLKLICLGKEITPSEDVSFTDPAYEITFVKGGFRIYQHDESLGEEPLQNVMVYLQSQQARTDKHLMRYLLVCAVLVFVLAFIPLSMIITTGKNPMVVVVIIAGLLGFLMFPTVSTFRDYTACIRVEGSTHWERNVDTYRMLIGIVLTAITTALATLWIVGK